MLYSISLVRLSFVPVVFNQRVGEVAVMMIQSNSDPEDSYNYDKWCYNCIKAEEQFF